MKSAKSIRIAIATCLMCSASPALASDFSGIIYFFLALLAVVGGVVVAVVWGARKLGARGSPKADAASAVVLAAVFAPATFVDMYGEYTFSLFPGWLLLFFGEPWSTMIPGPLISFIVTAIALYMFFKGRRAQHVADPADGEI